MSNDPADACDALKLTLKSLQLATVNADGEPHCGYTPFSVDGNSLIIFVSQLALHTRDLLATKQVAVMLIADEQSSSQIFARSRLSYQCRADVIAAEHAQYNVLLDAHEERHGKMVNLLRQLPDFVLFRLVPTAGMFVMSLGKAYKLTGPDLDQYVHASSA